MLSAMALFKVNISFTALRFTLYPADALTEEVINSGQSFPPEFLPNEAASKASGDFDRRSSASRPKDLFNSKLKSSPSIRRFNKGMQQ
jgi:hypothetical protein